MLKLMRYMKPYILTVIVIFGLLFAQAMADLALPDYMSRIVNVGLQQGGLESPAPIVVRSIQMDHLQLLMLPADQAFVTQSYELLDPAKLTAADLAKYSKDYPLLQTTAIYHQLKVSKSDLKRLETIFAKSITMLKAIETGALTSSTAAPANNTTSPGVPGLSQLPAGTDLFAVLAKLPEAQRLAMLEQANTKMAALSDTMLRQAATSWLSTEYDTVGLDAGQLQNNYIMRMGGLMMLLAFAGMLCAVIVGLLSARMAAGLSRDLRGQVFRKVLDRVSDHPDNQ
jgi:ATP-binding cassette subfamily B multidrug efflux pump